MWLGGVVYMVEQGEPEEEKLKPVQEVINKILEDPIEYWIRHNKLVESTCR